MPRNSAVSRWVMVCGSMGFPSRDGSAAVSTLRQRPIGSRLTHAGDPVRSARPTQRPTAGRYLGGGSENGGYRPSSRRPASQSPVARGRPSGSRFGGGVRQGRRGRGRVRRGATAPQAGPVQRASSARDDRRLGARGRRGLRRGRDVRLADQQRPLPARHRQPVRQGPAPGEVPAAAERRQPDRLRRLEGQAHRPGQQAGDQRLRQGDQEAAPRLQRHQPAQQLRPDGRPAVEGQADRVRAGPDGRLVG